MYFTFRDFNIFSWTCYVTVYLPNKIHVIQKGIKCIEIGEADLMWNRSTSYL